MNRYYIRKSERLVFHHKEVIVQLVIKYINLFGKLKKKLNFRFMNNKTWGIFLLVGTLFFSCQKDVKEPANFEKEILEFKLEDSINAGYLTETVHGLINESTIKIVLPQQIDARKLIATFDFKGKKVTVGSVEQQSSITPNDFTKPLVYKVIAEDGSERSYKIELQRSPELKSGVPHLYITTKKGAPIDSKENYVEATLRIDGGDVYENYEGTTGIKGRGNSTWAYPKKPYRLKLDTKAPLLGLSSEKDWILLANYLDGSLMLNAVAFKIARLLEMPFTNTAIPVDLTVNGKYLGNYMFTEQKEVEENRINVGKGGVLLELDTFFDEPWKFHSSKYKLPVMIQYPKLEKLAPAEANEQFEIIKNDFEHLLQKIADESFPNNDYLNNFDASALVKYLIVYDLCLNEEINHPKSVYLYKKENDKYTMGPIWDFDWAFGYEKTYKHFSNPEKPLFWGGTPTGGIFFKRFLEDPAIRTLYKKEWNLFRSEKLPELFVYIDNYAEVIKDSYRKDFEVWRRGSSDLNSTVQTMKDWLNARARYLDTYASGM